MQADRSAITVTLILRPMGLSRRLENETCRLREARQPRRVRSFLHLGAWHLVAA